MSDSEDFEIGILVDVSQVVAAAEAVQGLSDAGVQASVSVTALTASTDSGATALSVLTTQAKSVSDVIGGSGSVSATQSEGLSSAATKAVSSLSKSASSALSSALKSVVIDGTSFSDAASTFSTRLASSALTTVSSKMVDSLLNSLMGSVTSSSGSSGWLSSLFGFADGGVMTSAGPVALRTYASGGIADEPQLALFGEGASAEAYVPLPDGRSIPVTLQGAGGGGPAVNIQMTVAAQDAASFRRSEGQIGATVAAKLQRYMQRYG